MCRLVSCVFDLLLTSNSLTTRKKFVNMKISWKTFTFLCSALLFRCGDGFHAVGLVSRTSNTPLPAHYRKSTLPAHYRKSRTLTLMSSSGGNNDNGGGGGKTGLQKLIDACSNIDPASTNAIDILFSFSDIVPASTNAINILFSFMLSYIAKHDPEMQEFLQLVMTLIFSSYKS